MNESTKHPKHYASVFSCFCSNLQVIPSGGSHLVQMMSTIFLDPLDELDPVTHTFTPIEAGWYWFATSLAVAGLIVGDGVVIRLFRNLVQEAIKDKGISIVGTNPVSVTRLLYMLPTDTVHVEVTHNFGANRNISNGEAMTRFEGFRVA